MDVTTAFDNVSFVPTKFVVLIELLNIFDVNEVNLEFPEERFVNTPFVDVIFVAFTVPVVTDVVANNVEVVMFVVNNAPNVTLLIRAPPDMSNVKDGAVVPIPTLPLV
jgi:hypothetical protein